MSKRTIKSGSRQRTGIGRATRAGRHRDIVLPEFVETPSRLETTRTANNFTFTEIDITDSTSVDYKSSDFLAVRKMLNLMLGYTDKSKLTYDDMVEMVIEAIDSRVRATQGTKTRKENPAQLSLFDEGDDDDSGNLGDS